MFTLREVVEKTLRAAGRTRPIFPLGDGASYAFAAMAEWIPFVRLITRDNWRAMRMPSVCPREGNDAEKILGKENMTALDIGLARMFPRPAGYDALRRRARR